MYEINSIHIKTRPYILLFFFIGIFLSNAINTRLYSQEKEIDSLRIVIENTPNNNKEWFQKVMELAAAYREKRPHLDIIINGFESDYQNYGVAALEWAKKSGTPMELAQARRYEIDYILFYNHNIDANNFDFFSLGQQMINEGIFHSLEDEFYVYRILTDLYQEKGFYKEFLSLIPKKYELARELEKPFSEPFREYASIGTIYYRLKDYGNARIYYRKTLDSMFVDSLTLLKASINNNIALSFSKEEQIDSALYYYRKSLDIIETGHQEYYDYKTEGYNEHIKNVINANIAYLGVKRGKYDEAIFAIKKELYTGKREDEPSTVMQAYNKLGEIYYYKKEYTLAEKFLDSGKNFSHRGIHDEDEIVNIKQRAKLYLATNRQEEAEKLFTYAQKFKDSIDLIKSKQQTKVASVIYETQAKEKELQSQRLALAKKNEVILKKEKSQIIYGIILLILFASLLFFYWFNRKIKIQKAKVDDSLKEKELLLKEIHHRVKNNLQVVSSLLTKQGAVSDNEQVKKLMEDGQNRIKSMAMVHQLLYQTEDFRNLNLKEYTKILVSSISGSNQFHGRSIITHIHMDDIYSHIDIAVPYGLILNELLSNCFEHGFSEDGSGDITISVKELKKDEYCLTVTDTGKGIPVNIEERMKKSLGINLIEGLAWQLRGSLTYTNTKQGSQFDVIFFNNLNNIT